MQDGPVVNDHSDDDIWTPVTEPEPAAPVSDPPAPQGRSRGLGLVVVAMLLIVGGGVFLAAVFLKKGSDDHARRVGKATSVLPSYPKGEAPDVAPPEAVPTTEPRLVPTTQPGGILPTGCANWDPAFGFAPTSYEGLAIWSDFEGWHVRLAPGPVATVAGRLSAQVLPDIDDTPLPAGVVLTPDPDTASVAFTITPGDKPIGFDFQADCAQKQFTFVVNGPTGGPLPLEYVVLGKNGQAPGWPILAQRTPKTPGP